MTVASILLFGLLLGVRHALDGDHIAAVATLATRARSVGQAVGFGVAWGMGHTLTLMLCGGAVLLLGLVVPLRAAQALELAVGVMLVLLGANVLYRLWRERAYFHWHRHADGIAHVHAHGHAWNPGPHEPILNRHWHWRDFPMRPMVVGMMHGMAGSAALILVSLESVGSVSWRLAYFAIFGVGSILGMASLSVAIAVPLRLTSRHLTGAYGSLSAVVGLATVILGIAMIHEFGVAAGVASQYSATQ